MRLLDLFEPIGSFLDGFAFYMLLLFIVVLPINAAALSLAAIRHQRRAIAVTAKVANIHQRTDNDENVTYAPEFEIIKGRYTGTVWTSRMTSGAPDHAVGDVLPASYSPKTGVIHSRKTMGGSRFIAIGMLGMGILFLYVFLKEY